MKIIIGIIFIILSASALAQEAILPDSTGLAGAAGADKVEWLNRLAEASIKTAPERSIEYSQWALELADSLQMMPARAEALKNLGMAYRFQGELPEALEKLKEALRFSQEHSLRATEGDAAFGCGSIYLVLSEYDQALDYTLRALKIYQETASDSGAAEAYKSMGIVYWYLKDYVKALENFDLCLGINQRLRNKGGIAAALNNIGMVYDALGKYREALENYRTSLDLKKETGDSWGISNTLVNLGLVYKDLKLYEKANDYNLQAMKVKGELGDKKGIASCCNNIAEAFTLQGDYDRAMEYLQQGLSLAEELNARSLIKENYALRLKIYADKGDLPAYVKYNAMHDKLGEEIFSEESSEKMARLRTIFETEQKEKEIDILKKDAEIQELRLKKEIILRNVFILGSILILFAAGLIFYLYRLRTKAMEELSRINQELKTALHEVKRLSGLLPICANCKKIRNDQGYWEQIEEYISQHSEADFSHGICPDCAKLLYPEYYNKK